MLSFIENILTGVKMWTEDKIETMSYVISSHINELHENKQDKLVAGDNIEISGDTISASNDNSWREIKVNDHTFLSSATTSAALTLSAGTNVVLTESDGVVTINSQGGGGGGITYFAGNNINIDNTNHIISAVGYTFDNTSKSFSESVGNTANGNYSHAEGFSTNANGGSSHAEGRYTYAYGGGSHAEGVSVVVGHAYGVNNNIPQYAYGCHGEGYEVASLGMRSHVEGQGVASIGSSSHAEGTGTEGTDYWKKFVGETIFNVTSGSTGATISALNILSSSTIISDIAIGDIIIYKGSYVIIDNITSNSGYYKLSFNRGWFNETLNNVDISTINSGEDLKFLVFRSSVSLGNSSHIEGEHNIAYGRDSHAEGSGTRAIGDYSHAEGSGTITGGNNLTSSTVYINGHYSGNNSFTVDKSPYDYFSIGETVVINNNEFIISYLNSGPPTISFTTDLSESDYQWALNNPIKKYYSILGHYSHAEGSGTTASGLASHAEGSRTTASGNYSHAEGSGTIASGLTSHAEGSGTTASGICSHAEGYNTTVSGNYSHAEGWGTTASGLTSHAEGRGATASGPYSHAEGSGTTASGDYSHAGGLGTIANKPQMTAIGKYNKEGVKGTLFAVGNGVNSTNTSNAFTVNSGGSFTATATVNGVADVYLGCPIGTSLMWMGTSESVPIGWRLCDGYGVRIQIPGEYYTGKTIKKYCWLSRNGGTQVCTGEMVDVATYADNFSDYIDLIGVINTSYTYENSFTYNGATYYYGISDTHVGVTTGTSVVAEIFNNNEVTINLPNLQQRFPLGASGTSWDCGGTTYYTGFGKTGGTKEVSLSISQMPSHNHTMNFIDGEMADRAYAYTGETVTDLVTGFQMENSIGGTHTPKALKNVDRLQIASGSAQYNYIINYTGGGAAHNNIPPYLAVNFIIKYK